MKKLITILFLLFAIVLYSQNIQDTTWKARINKIENKLIGIDKQNTTFEIENIKNKLDYQQKLNEQTYTSISNQLDAASYNLTLFGILFAMAAIAIGVYVTKIERTVVRIGVVNKELLVKNQKIKEDVEAVNNLIKNNIHNLYLQIKREETDYILDRLIKVPKEIKNVGYTLLSRELQPEDFSKFRKAYINLEKNDSNDKFYYNQIFNRHFLAQMLKDEMLRKEFSGYIGYNIHYSLENEIMKCTADFANVLVDGGIQEYKKEINHFFWGLTVSKYEEYHNVYQLLFDNLRSRKNRFDTFNVVESVQDKLLAKIAFGNLLLNQYSTDNLAESERLAFIELSDLKEAQKKFEEDSNQKQEKEKEQH